MFGKRGESVLPYLGKGQLVGISGEVTLRSYDQRDGGKGVSLDVRVNDLTLLGGKKDTPKDSHSEVNENAAKAKPAKPASFDDFDDDIPF